MSQGTKVQTLKFHTFAGKDYNEGDTYVVKGDGHQTTEQYLDTLQAVGFVKVAGEEGIGPNIIQEVGDQVEAPKAPEPESKPVAPLSTEDVPAKPKAAKAARSKPAKSKR